MTQEFNNHNLENLVDTDMPQQCEKLSSLGALSSKFSDLKVISGGGGGVVLSGVDKHLPDKESTNVALKRLSLVGKGHCRGALRELRLLKRFNHENVVKTYKITDPCGCTIEDPSMENFKDIDSVYVVEELLDSDLHKVIEKNDKLPLDTTKLFMYQLLRGLKFIHSANVIHRDIKPGNLFIKAEDLTLKIGDYGLSRVFDDKYEHKGYLTALVSTRYYRAPEVMLSLGDYSYGIDIWSAGCVFGELLLGKTIFPGDNDLDQMNVISSAFGIEAENIYEQQPSFPEHWFENIPPEALDLISKLLCIDPSERVTAEEALQHPFFADLHDPTDEPLCEQPFHIEHEIDNLPIKILKRKILRNSCMTSFDNDSKKSYHSSEENLFKDFDETFIHNVSHRQQKTSNHIQLNSRGDEAEYSDYKSSSYNNSSYESYTSHSSHQEPGYSNYSKITCETNKDLYFPSLTDAMSREVLVDEPYRDPGVCERKYHEAIKTEIMTNLTINNDNDQQSSYFSGLSPVIELSEQSKFIDDNKSQSFLEIPGHYCADRASVRNSHKYKRKMGHKSSHDHDSKSASKQEQSMKFLNEDILRTLSERGCQENCSLQDLMCGKLKNSPPLVHWDSLRFWI